MEKRLQRAEWAAALLITLFAVGLHALRLVHAGPLWRDEASSFHLATSPDLGEVIAKHESFPPPFFFLVRGWAAVLGGSDFSLRLFGLLVGLGLVALFWWSSRRTGTVPLAALSLVAINPTFLLYGDSLRGYGLGCVAIVAAFGAFARLAARPDRRAIAAAMATAVLSVQFLFFNVPLLFALGLAAIAVGILRRRPRVVWAVAAIGAATALALLPWTGSVLATRPWIGLLRVPLGLREIFGGMAWAAAPIKVLRWAWVPLGVLALLPVASATPAEEEREDMRLFARLALPGVVLAQWGFLEALEYSPRPWYYLAVLAVAAAALDVRLASSPALRSARLGAAVLAVLALALPALSAARTRMTNVDLVAARIEAEAAPGDLVVVVPWYVGVSYLRYARGSTPWMTAPDLADHRIHRFDLLHERMAEPEPLAGVLGAVERTLRAGQRVWMAGLIEGSPPELEAFLRDHGVHGEPVPVPWKGPVNVYEHLDLFVFRGWRTPG
jgi:hypothetical protein